MDLLYPVTPEVLTTIEYLISHIAASLRQECELTITQYRALSSLHLQEPTRPKEVANMLSVTSGMISQALNHLVNEGLVISLPLDGKRLNDLYLSRVGKIKRHDADIVVSQLCHSLFSALDADSLTTLRMGTLITNRLNGPMRMKGSRFFADYAILESFLAAELLFIESSHRLGHSLTEVRVLYELLERGPLTCSTIADRLFLTKQAITAAAKPIVAQGWAERLHEPGDQRVVRLKLTSRGRAHTQSVIIELDKRAAHDFRAWTPGETQGYAETSRQFVESRRKNRGVKSRSRERTEAL